MKLGVNDFLMMTNASGFFDNGQINGWSNDLINRLIIDPIKLIFKFMTGVLVVLVLYNPVYSHEAEESSSFTINGYVKDSKNGESLFGAAIYVQELTGGTITNEYGFYSLTLPEGNYSVDFSYIGYGTITKNIELFENQRIDIELVEEVKQIAGVVILGERLDQNVTSTEMSVNKLDIKTIQKMPAFLGEVDIIKSIQLLPGVSTVGEGASGFNVRGGGVGQNLVLLDDAPVYNSSHLLGFFSVFNPDAVKDVKLYKGGVPSMYGGRIASILDIKMKEGNAKQLGVQGGIGTVFSRFAIEAPIVKDKGSFIIAGRRSYADLLARTFTNAIESGQAFNFWDLTLKANYHLGDKDRIFLSGYLGQDIFQFDDNQGFNWGNRTATVRWNHLFSSRLFFNLTSYFSDYTYELSFGEDNTDRFVWDSRIRSTALKPEFSYSVNANNEIYFGGEMLYYRFDPANAEISSVGEITNISLDPKHAYEMAGYIGNKQTIFSNLGLEYGIRFSSFMFTGPGKVYHYEETEPGKRKNLTEVTEVGNREPITSYSNLEPRISIRYQMNPTNSVKASYNRMAQYLHLVSNTTASNPLDVWMPSTNNVEPETAHAFALGYFRNFRNNGFETSLEVYYRSTENQIEYIDGADLLINEFKEADLLSGIGRAYGMELLLKKNAGRFSGWVGYTLGKTEMKVDGINRSEWYPTRFDQRHNISLTGTYTFNERWSCSANFSYITGTPTTFPTSRFEMQGYVVPHNSFESRNNIRIQDYHRLDISVRLDGKKVKRGKERKNSDYWVFGVYNVYARRNPFSVYFSQDSNRPIPGQPIATQATQLSIIGSFIPSISYNFNF